ncbi:Panacea domain-containing protein [Polyangium jinanense]|uniref:DUF4065 domain-containing protein n=1 Tax=Polyangium jinanense TaxID=2829994 RepID=A0A9X4AYA6_9BACT|nr:type II toxin-antitoxin system antitoxin SocA domain-containing protein [Polyangium jinanense]MDC3962538.1 DUF4065 domain-containing protein [Polyangium jinanense]MDC3989359.1 DUF4065 domain-containing protein [Polyangium jinanense]
MSKSHKNKTAVAAADVATYILEKHGSMTAMKLQKLVYYCQAWNLVREEQLLFDDPIEAWADGPVVRSLYERHRGRFVVNAEDFSGDTSKLSDADKKTIDKVINRYGKYSAGQLSDLTHEEQPWIEARAGLEPLERGNQIIDPTVMQEFYTALAHQRRS